MCRIRVSNAVLVALILVLAAGLAGCPRINSGFVEFTSTPVTETFPLDAGGLLNIANDVGSISVVGTDGNAVVVTYTKKAQVPRGPQGVDHPAAFYLDQISVNLSGGEAAVTVEGEVPNSTEDFSGSVEFTIQAPIDAVTELRCNVGSASIDGMQGALDLDLDVGSAEIGLDVAPVATGDITCNVGVGDINLRLPDESIFTLDARVDVGGIDISDAFGIEVDRSSIVGAAASGESGPNGATFTLDANVGAIRVLAR